MRCERHDEPGRSSFLVSDVDPSLERALETLHWKRVERGWQMSFSRCDAGQAARAFANLPKLFERGLAMTADRTQSEWEPALQDVCDRLSAHQVDWWLTGSAALAVRGAPLFPGDLDLVVSDADAKRVGDILIDGLIEPVGDIGWPISNWFGRAILGTRVEWVGGVTADADVPVPGDFGTVAAERLQTVRWAGRDVRVPPLDLQRSVSERRGLDERVVMIDALERAAGF